MESNSTYKVVLVGDTGVGKSSLLRRYTEDGFNSSEQTTVGVDFRMQKCRISDKTSVNLQIWDTAGQERYRSMTKVYFRAADVIVVVYDITSKPTFSNLSYWLNMARESSKPGAILYLVGNKLDQLEFNRGQVTREEGLNYARMHSMGFVEVSAKSNVGVNEIFVDCASMLVERALRKHSIDDAVRKNGVNAIQIQSNINGSKSYSNLNQQNSSADLKSKCFC